MTHYQARFGGIARLYGKDGQEKLHHAHVCVVGIGGVGSWVVEALARTGVGALTLVDLDDICISNTNRQIHSITGEFGKPKVAAMAERVRLIQPDCKVHALHSLFTRTTAAEILATRYDGVVDAIDSPSMKALLIARCHELKLPIVATGGAGGRRNPTAVQVTDFARVTHDRLIFTTRKLLRVRHHFPRDTKKNFGVDCVYSAEPQVFPGRDGTMCTVPETGSSRRLDCRSGLGTAGFVTGAFGLAAAAQIVHRITASKTSEEA